MRYLAEPGKEVVMWLSRKKLMEFEGRIADLEKEMKAIQSQLTYDPEKSKQMLTDSLRRIQSKPIG